jgi:hypothetical protein
METSGDHPFFAIWGVKEKKLVQFPWCGTDLMGWTAPERHLCARVMDAVTYS